MRDPTLLFSALRMHENQNKHVQRHFIEKKSFITTEGEYIKENLVKYFTRLERKTDFKLKICVGSKKTRRVTTLQKLDVADR